MLFAARLALFTFHNATAWVKLKNVFDSVLSSADLPA